MDKTYETRKVAADKIALLCLFIVALLIARFIVTSRSAIAFSEPIKLSHTGLSVSIPAGNGWRSEKKWKYQQNAFTLSSVFTLGSGGLPPQVHCRYLLAAPKPAPDMRVEQRASAVGGTVVKTGQIQTGMLTIDWAHIKKPKMPLDLFFGTVKLPNSRRLDIEVFQTTGDTELAEQVFKGIAESLKFEDNQLLEAGSEIVTEIKNTGIDRFLYNKSRQTFFLIKDAAGRAIGFTMDVLIDSGRDAQLNIQAASFFYIRGRYGREQTAFFQSRNNLNEFTWKSEASGMTGVSGAELNLDEAGVMTVRKFSPRPEEKDYQLSSAAIPEVFLEFVFGQMLDSDHEKIIVDIIDADGRITPALVSKIETEDTAAAEEDGYILKVEFLDGRGFSERVYLDSQYQISKSISQQDGTYTLERSSIKDIAIQFPERADYILQKNKMLEQSQPQ